MSVKLLAVQLLLASLVATSLFAPTVTHRHCTGSLDLTFTVDLAKERFDASAATRVRVNEPTSQIVLNAIDLDFEEATVLLERPRDYATFINPPDVPPIEVSATCSGRRMQLVLTQERFFLEPTPRVADGRQSQSRAVVHLTSTAFAYPPHLPYRPFLPYVLYIEK